MSARTPETLIHLHNADTPAERARKALRLLDYPAHPDRVAKLAETFETYARIDAEARTMENANG